MAEAAKTTEAVTALERATKAAKAEINRLQRNRYTDPNTGYSCEGLGWKNLEAVSSAAVLAVLMAIRDPGMDVGLIGAEQVNIQMRGPIKADYFAAQDSFAAMIDAILAEEREAA